VFLIHIVFIGFFCRIRTVIYIFKAKSQEPRAKSQEPRAKTKESLRFLKVPPAIRDCAMVLMRRLLMQINI